MKNKDLKDLLTSINQDKEFNPVMVKNIRLQLHTSQAKFAHMIGVSIDTFL